jgi:hypothetical protein
MDIRWWYVNCEPLEMCEMRDGKNMNLIDKVAELKERETHATSGECIVIEDDNRSGDFLIIQNKEHWAWKDRSNSPDAQYLAALRNITPMLLDILKKIRPGDKSLLDDLIDMVDTISVGGVYEFPSEPRYFDMIDCLRRYQAMASKMTEENK